MTHQITQTWSPAAAPILSEKTFAEAVVSYVERGGDGRFLDRSLRISAPSAVDGADASRLC